MSENWEKEFIRAKNEQIKTSIFQNMEAHSGVLLEFLKVLFPSNHETHEAVGALYDFQEKMRIAIKKNDFLSSPFSLSDAILKNQKTN